MDGQNMNTNDSRDQGILHSVHRAGQTLEDAFSKAARQIGLTPRQHIVLLAVSRNPDASQTRLVGETGIDRSTLADVVRRLQTKNLIHRQRSKFDARSYNVRLTEYGAEQLRLAEPIVTDLDQRILSILGPERLAQLSENLTQLIDGLQQTEMAELADA